MVDLLLNMMMGTSPDYGGVSVIFIQVDIWKYLDLSLSLQE